MTRSRILRRVGEANVDHGPVRERVGVIVERTSKPARRTRQRMSKTSVTLNTG